MKYLLGTLMVVAAPAVAQPGHGVPKEQGSAPHAGPDMPDPPAGPPSAAARGGPAHAADSIFGSAAMAPARAVARREHGAIKSSGILIDRLEVAPGAGKDRYAWDVAGWYGGDINKLWVKAGDGVDEGSGSVEAQVLWSRALDPWWNLQAGVRHDFRGGPERTHAVLGVEGLAPYWFDIDAALFLSDKGDFTARIKAEYDQRLTQKLILQPALELNFAAQDMPELGMGSGLATAELGLRLRYRLVPEFAPYVGLNYERAFGRTAAFWRARDESRGGWHFLIGIRAWF